MRKQSDSEGATHAGTTLISVGSMALRKKKKKLDWNTITRMQS